MKKNIMHNEEKIEITFFFVNKFGEWNEIELSSFVLFGTCYPVARAITNYSFFLRIIK